MNSKSRIIRTDEDPSLRIESSAIINLRGVSTKLNKYKVYMLAWAAGLETELKVFMQRNFTLTFYGLSVKMT